MISIARRPKTQKPRKLSKRVLGFVDLLALVGWATITLLLAILGLVASYPIDGAEGMDSEAGMLVWYWVAGTAVAGCISAIVRRRRLAYFWKTSHKLVEILQLLLAVLFGVLNGALLAFLLHVTETKHSLLALFASYPQFQDHIPAPS